MNFKRYADRGILPLSVSQNFLTSKRIIKQLLRLTSIDLNDFVIEIGAGKGHITAELSKKCRKLSAIEIDKKLYNNLLIKLNSIKNLRIINADFMKYKLPAKGDYKVFSNIPFSLTTSIIRKLTCWHNPPVEGWLFMEKGTAKRFLGVPNDSINSKKLKARFDLDIMWHFRREDFHPMPNVDVVLLHFKRKF